MYLKNLHSFRYNKMSVGWNLNDSITFLLANVSFLCTPPKCEELSDYTNSAHTGGGSFLKINKWVRCV